MTTAILFFAVWVSPVQPLAEPHATAALTDLDREVLAINANEKPQAQRQWEETAAKARPR